LYFHHVDSLVFGSKQGEKHVVWDGGLAWGQVEVSKPLEQCVQRFGAGGRRFAEIVMDMDVCQPRQYCLERFQKVEAFFSGCNESVSEIKTDSQGRGIHCRNLGGEVLGVYPVGYFVGMLAENIFDGDFDATPRRMARNFVKPLCLGAASLAGRTMVHD
jgi:hypothetical protein